MTEEGLLKLAEEKGWSWISQHQTLPEWFIEKYKRRLDLPLIARYQTLSKEFIEKNRLVIDILAIRLERLRE